MNLQDLKKNIPYQWKVQTASEWGCQCVAYIDSRDVQDLLDEVCGPDKWQCDYKQVKNNLYCGIGILINDQWIWKWDCGTESNTEKEKGEASDSFKRAAVKWGVGRFLYDLEIKKVSAVQDKRGKYAPADNNGNILYGKQLTDFINSGTSKPQKASAKQDREPIKQDGKPWLNKGTDEYNIALKLAQSGQQDKLKAHCSGFKVSKQLGEELKVVLDNNKSKSTAA